MTRNSRKFRVVITRHVSGQPKFETEMDVRAISWGHALDMVAKHMGPVGKYYVSQVWQRAGKPTAHYWKLVPWGVWRGRQFEQYSRPDSSHKRSYAERLEEEVLLAIKPIADKYRRRMKKGSRAVEFHCSRAIQRVFPWGGRNS
jgi:hypothetical protein